ncbi:hypothetical protein ABNX05_23930, partial [Lysinibacillus sp. M3]
NKTKTCCRYVALTLSRKRHLLARDPGASIASEAGRGTKAKSFTSCDNAFVTNILLPRRPQEALICAKAKRQQHSAQSERKSTPRFAEEPDKDICITLTIKK